MRVICFFSGEGGIRTRDSVSTIHTFQACSFNHSDTSPFCAKKSGRKNKPSTPYAANNFNAFEVVTDATSSTLIPLISASFDTT